MPLGVLSACNFAMNGLRVDLSLRTPYRHQTSAWLSSHMKSSRYVSNGTGVLGAFCPTVADGVIKSLWMSSNEILSGTDYDRSKIDE